MERDVGRDARVPVAIGRRSTTRTAAATGAATGRVPVRPASTASAGGASSARAPAAGRDRVERPVERADVARDDREQRLVEDRERRPHLVERRRQHGPQVAGVPQQRDLLAQASPQVRVLVGRRQGVVERVEQPPDPAQRDQQRAPPGLGGVGGEHRVDLDRAQPAPRARPGRVTAASRSTASPRDSSIGRPFAAPRPRPQHADPLALLREVDELEVEGERAGDGRRVLDVERPRSPRPRRSRSMSGSRTTSGSPRRSAIVRRRMRSTEREQLGTGLLRDDLAEQRAEQPDLVRQRVARAAQPGPRRLGRDGRKPGRPRAGRGPSRSGSAVGHGDRMRGAHGAAASRRRLRFDCKGTGPVPGRNRFR